MKHNVGYCLLAYSPVYCINQMRTLECQFLLEHG